MCCCVPCDDAAVLNSVYFNLTLLRAGNPHRLPDWLSCRQLHPLRSLDPVDASGGCVELVQDSARPAEKACADGDGDESTGPGYWRQATLILFHSFSLFNLKTFALLRYEQ